jgi:uncharacterized protein
VPWRPRARDEVGMTAAGALVDRSRIPYLHWQERIGRNEPALGEIVHGLEDLEQAIHTIVLTEQGTVPLAPFKCTKLLPYVDRGEAEAIPNFTREIWDAVTTFEPRVVVTSVKPRRIAFSHWKFPIFFFPRADVTRRVRQTEVTYAPS